MMSSSLTELFQVLNEDDDTWTLFRSGPLAGKGSGENSWTDLVCGLTDKFCTLLVSSFTGET
jgi:hypothetical protein